MKTKYINVGDKDWGIIFCYNFSQKDFSDIYAIARTFGMSEKKVRKSLDILSELNTGMTISRNDLRMSAIFVSDATSYEEWWDSVEHELSHATAHIIDYYNVPYDSEDAAYLAGYLMKKVVHNVAKPCR